MHISIKCSHLPFGLGFLHRNPSLILFLVLYNIYSNSGVYNNKVKVDPTTFLKFKLGLFISFL